MSARPRDELLHERRDEDLAAFGVVGDPGGEHDAAAEEIALAMDRLARVDADPHADGEVVARGAPQQGALDVDGAGHRAAGAGERDHESVALRLDLVTAVLVDLGADDRVVLLSSSSQRSSP